MHAESCQQDPRDIYGDGTHRYCGECGAFLAIWPEDSDRGWEDAS